MERLFGAMCQHLSVLPGETFVEQAGRWNDALRFAASLKPRDHLEWLRAADVTVKQFSAMYSLTLRRRAGITDEQRDKHGHNFLVQAKAMRDARMRYERLRRARPG